MKSWRPLGRLGARCSDRRVRPVRRFPARSVVLPEIYLSWICFRTQVMLPTQTLSYQRWFTLGTALIGLWFVASAITPILRNLSVLYVFRPS